jgi:mRNA interferase MazF
VTRPALARGDVWLAEAGGKVRPVLVLTRAEVLDVRVLVTVAEITSSIRGLRSEVPIPESDVALDLPSVVNCDGLHTVPQRVLTHRVGQVGAVTLAEVCAAVAHAIGCPAG